MNFAVSVIMPVYNSEKYLSVAIESVLQQDFEDFELILVDDGSSDKSPSICDAYAKKDKRIKVVHKENGGICDARNFGIQVAKGEYIAFIDNDDEYLPGLLKDNYELAKKYDADVVRFERIKQKIYLDGHTSEEKRQGIKILKGRIDGVVCYNKEQMLENYDLIKRSGAFLNVWTGIYRTALVKSEGLFFDVKYKYGCEDIQFNVLMFRKVNTYVFNEKSYYLYKWRQTHSTSAKFQEARLDNILHTAKTELKYLKYKQIDEAIRLLVLLDYIYFFCKEVNGLNCQWKISRKKRYIKYIFYKLHGNEIALGSYFKAMKIRKISGMFGMLLKFRCYRGVVVIQKMYAFFSEA